MDLEIIHDETATEVGSYFVANYPPFSVWSADHVPRARSVLERVATSPDVPLGLYLHVPFCRKRCKFCYFRVYTDKNARDVDVYLDALVREVELYADLPAVDGRPLAFAYFGGGTPSFLSSGQLERLVAALNRHLPWKNAREVTFECEPGTLKKSKLRTIRSIGVTRLSLGIEHFDDDVLVANGRAHKSAEVYRAFEWARAVDFPQINVDLIAGMLHDTEDKWLDAVEKALALAPDSVTIYQMEVPANTVIARQSSAGRVPVADWPTKRRWVDTAFRRFEEAGYVVSSAYTLVKPSADSPFVYRDALWHGADMIGTGVASFSHLGGVHFQNADQWDDYVDVLLRDGQLPLARACPMSPLEQLTREFLLQLKLGHVDDAYFVGKFGTSALDLFQEPVNRLSRLGYLEQMDDGVRLTRTGLLRVDALLPAFYEPRYREVRYT